MNTKRVISIIVIAVIIIGGGIGLYYYSRHQSKSDSDKTTSEDWNGNTNSTNTNENTNTEIIPSTQLTGSMLELAQSRDAKRLNDVRAISTALESYRGDKGNYPTELSSLVPQYLPNIPENPTPGGLSYDYTPIGSEPYTYYSLYYNLEAGSGDVISGDHEATPDGIATM
jgi:type II secretory pathway pseudopilin PulG